MSSLGIMTDNTVDGPEFHINRVSDAVPILPSIQFNGGETFHTLKGPLIQSSAHLNPSFEDLGVTIKPDFSYLKRKGSMPQVVRSPFTSESEHLFPAQYVPVSPKYKNIAPLPPLQPKAVNVPRFPTPPNTPVEKPIIVSSPTPHSLLAVPVPQRKPSIKDMEMYDFQDPVTLLLLLAARVNLSKFGFDRPDSPEMRFVSKVKSESSQSTYGDDDDYAQTKRKKRRAPPVDYGTDDVEGPSSSPMKKETAMKCSSPISASSPRAPYKGRYGLHPTCGSCGTTKTPYWRESWTEAFILCNACGLRFSKFRRRCVKCNYVPRKEDKGARECTQCGGSWSL